MVQTRTTAITRGQVVFRVQEERPGRGEHRQLHKPSRIRKEKKKTYELKNTKFNTSSDNSNQNPEEERGGLGRGSRGVVKGE